MTGSPPYAVRSSRRVFDGVVASVRVDDVVMPDGKTAAREVVEHGGAVAVVALEADHVLLISHYRHPLGRRLWELPAGLRDVDQEPAEQTAARELFEETGFRATNWSVLLDVASSPGFTDELVRIYLATGVQAHPRPPGEHEEADLQVVRVPLDNAVRAALQGRIVNALAVAGILAAHAVRTGAGQPRTLDDIAPGLADHAPGNPAAPAIEGQIAG